MAPFVRPACVARDRVRRQRRGPSRRPPVRPAVARRGACGRGGSGSSGAGPTRRACRRTKQNSPPAPSSQKWFAVTMMQNSVASGYRNTTTRCQRRRSSGHMATAHHVDQPMCMLGIAAYWFERSCIVSESNDHGPAELGQGVDEPERAVVAAQVRLDARAAVLVTGLVEQPRGHQREQGEADDRQRRHDRQAVAPHREHAGALPEQQDEHGERDDEVGRAVVRVPELDEPRVRQERLLDRLLVVEAEELLDADDLLGVAERRRRQLARFEGVGAEQVPGPRVHEVEGDDDQRLLPPVQPVATLGERAAPRPRT